MFTKTILLALVAVVAAVPTAYEAPSQGSGSGTNVQQGDSCGAGSTVHCCDNDTADKVTNNGLIPINADLQSLLGQCNDVTTAVLGGAVPIKLACSQQAVCCGETSQNGLVNLGCTPVNI